MLVQHQGRRGREQHRAEPERELDLEVEGGGPHGQPQVDEVGQKVDQGVKVRRSLVAPSHFAMSPLLEIF